MHEVALSRNGIGHIRAIGSKATKNGLCEFAFKYVHIACGVCVTVCVCDCASRRVSNKRVKKKYQNNNKYDASHGAHMECIEHLYYYANKQMKKENFGEHCTQ